MVTNNFDPTQYGATPFNPIDYGATPFTTTTSPQKEGLLNRLFKGATKPAVTMMVRPVQAAMAIGNKLGDWGGIGGEPNLDVNLPYYGNIEAPTTGKDIIKDVGRGIETVSLGIGGGGANIIKNLVKQPLLNIAKQSAIQGAKVGGAFGLGSGLEETGTAGGALESGIMGTIGGSVLGFSTPFLGKGITPILKETTKALKRVGSGISGMTITPPKSEIKSFIDYNAFKPTLWERVKNIWEKEKLPTVVRPISTGETAAKLVNPGTERGLASNAKRTQMKLWNNIISPALDNIKEKVNMKNFFTDLKQEIIDRTPDLNRKNQLLKTLDTFKNSYKNVFEISYNKLQDYKSGWAELVPEKYYSGDIGASPLNLIRGLASDKARNMIYEKVSPEIKTAYMDYGNLRNLYEEGINSVPRIDVNSITRQAWQTILDNILTPITTTAGKIVYKTGQGMEFIGDAGAKKIGDIIGADFFAVPSLKRIFKTR